MYCTCAKYRVVEYYRVCRIRDVILASPIVSGVYVLLLTDCTGSLCFVTHRLYLEFKFCYSPIVPGVYVLLLTDCTRSLCFITHRLYWEFMFCYSPIVPRVYVLLHTDCTGSLCFVTHRLYREFVLLLTDCTESLCFVTHRLNRVICCIWYVYETDPIPVKFSHIGNELYIDIRMFGYYHHICMHNTPLW